MNNETAVHSEAEKPVLTLKQWRERRGFSWTWLARMTGLSYPSLATSWGYNDRPVPEAAKAAIARALEITPDQIADTAPLETTEAPAIVPQEPQASAEAVSDRRHGDRRAPHVA